MTRTTVGVVDVPEKTGGRKVFVSNLCKMLGKAGCEATVIVLDSASVSDLNKFDVLHFSDPRLMTRYFWKVILVRRPVKILTIHGWIVEEGMFSLKEKNNLREVLGELFWMISWMVFVKPFFIKLFDAVTCPSLITAQKNGLKSAMIIKNPGFPELLEGVKEIDVRSQHNELVFASYVSIGGIKVGALQRLIRLIAELNDKLASRKVLLLVFGRLPVANLRQYPAENLGKYVRFMGYSEKFSNILKASDLFLDSSSFSELGFAAIEAGLLGIPIAKFADPENWQNEELHDGKTGIVAFSDHDMVDKLLSYVSRLTYNKHRMGTALRRYLLMTRSWRTIAEYWITMFGILLAKKRKN